MLGNTGGLMGDQCPKTELGDATQQVVILAFDLVGKEITKLPAQLDTTLQSEPVQKAIKEALQAFALKKVSSGTTQVTDEEAKKLGEALLKSADKLTDGVVNQIKKSSEFKRLEESLKELETALKCSPMGIWVDRNKGVLFIVGIGMALGSAAALYLTKTGGPVIDLPISQIKEKPFQIFKVGSLTLKGQLLEFKPDKQILGAGLLATQKWDKVELSLKLGVIAAGTEVKEVQGQAIVKSNEFSVTVDGKATPENKQVNLGLGVGFTGNGLPGPLNISVGAVITDGEVTGGTLTGSMKTKYGDVGLQGQADSKQYGGMLTFTVPW
jgi:hypothetical protein